MIIGVDIDNVIADTEKELRRVLLETKGIRLNREDITNYSLNDIGGIDPETLRELLAMFNEGDVFSGLEVIDGASETLELLMKAHRVELVTSRPEKLRLQTEAWLARNNVPYHELKFASHSKVNGVPYELFLEDQDNFARELAESGTFVLLFDAPWNRHVEHENIDRVYSWEDVQRFCFPPCAMGH